MDKQFSLNITNAPMKKIKNYEIENQNNEYVNDYLSKAISNSKKNLNELSFLMKEKLGSRVIDFQDIEYTSFDRGYTPSERKSRNKSRKGGGRDYDNYKKRGLVSSIYGGGGGGRRSTKKKKFQFRNNSKFKNNVEILEYLNEINLPVNFLPGESGNNRSDIGLEGIDEVKRKEKHLDYLDKVFSRAKSLLECLWNEMHVSKKDRESFKKLTFYSVSMANYILIHREICKLMKIRKIQHDILKNIETREMFLKRLNVICQKEVSSLLLAEVNNIVELLRKTTIHIVYKIVDWRNNLPRLEIFKWNGVNYLKKLQNDLNFLEQNRNCNIKKICKFSLLRNPLLIPNNYRCEKFKNIMEEENDNVINESQTCPYYLSNKYFRTLNTTKIDEADNIIFSEDDYLKQVLNLQKLEEAAIKIQKIARGFLARKKVGKLKEMRKKYEALKESEERKNTERDLKNRKTERHKIVQNNEKYYEKYDNSIITKKFEEEFTANGRYSLKLI